MARTTAGRFAQVDRPPATPREVLARAVAERKRIEQRIEQLRQAIIQARENSMSALGHVDDAEAALAEAERTEQRRAVALALGEPHPAGPSVDEARQALIEARHAHQLARSAIATLEAGARDLEPQLTFAGERVRNALVAVVEAEGGVKHLLEAYDDARIGVERIALALRLLGPTFKISAGIEHPDRALPRHDASLADAWRTVLKALEDGEVETALPGPA
jgi:hypothetical protein